MTRRLRRSVPAIALGLVLPLHVWGQERRPASAPSAEAQELAPGVPIARELLPGRRDDYRVRLEAGAFMRVTVEQLGMDVVAAASDPTGHELLTVDAMDDEYRPETLVLTALGEGIYRIYVMAAPRVRVAGRYRIRVDLMSPARDEHLVAIRAEQQFARGRRVREPNRAATWPDALDLFTSALADYRQLADRAGELKALIEIAITQYYLSRPEAVGTARAAERLARELGDHAAAARALKSAGNALVFHGDLTEAVRAFEESITLSREVGHRNAAARALNDLAIAYRRLGEVERAVAAYEQALPLARATEDREMEANILANLGVAYRSLGNHLRSLQFYEQALQVRRESGDSRGAFNLLLNAGNLHRDLRRFDEANAFHAEALHIAAAGGDRGREGVALNSLGLNAAAEGRYDEALAHQRAALSRHQAVGDQSGEAAVFQGIGASLKGLGRHDDAREALQAALAIDRRLRERYAERDVLGRLAEVERDTGNLAAATTYAEASATLDEELRAEIVTPELRASFIAAEQDRYQQFVEILQRRHQAEASSGHDARALEVSERARARVLLDTLASAHVDLREGVDPALLAQQRSLEQSLDRASSQLSRALASDAGSDAAKSAASRVDHFTSELQQLRASIRRRNPRYASATLPQPLTASEIQRRVVDADTVLLEYMLGEERSWLWAVTTQGITSVALPPRQAIERAVRSLHGDLSARQPVPGESDASYAQRVRRADARLARDRAALSQVLLGGIAGKLDGVWRRKRLAIVATGVLEYVPFAALFTPEVPASVEGRSVGSDRGARRVSLAARHEIVVIPSASVLDALRRDTADRPPAPMAAAVLGDPVFEPSDPRVRRPARTAGAGGIRRVALAQTRGIEPPGDMSAATHASTRGALARLPFSREEAAAIASLVPDGKVTLATDFKASRRTVLDGALRGHRVVHFATHGVFDAGSPALSGLVLSLVDERGNPQDGFVRLNDIYNMRLDADLVILSACRTALGEEIKGEGLVGLTRAFMYAGAPRVVASLWQVSDVATAELMKRFYRALFVDRLRPAAALRAAQLELSRDPRWSAPYYWAGFVLQGEWR